MPRVDGCTESRGLCSDERFAAFLLEFRFEIFLLALALLQYLTLLFKIVFVAPQFRSIFNAMNVELPLVTQVIMRSSDVLQGWWFLLVVPGLWVTGKLFLSIPSKLALRWWARRDCSSLRLAVAAYPLGLLLSTWVLDLLGRLFVSMPMLCLVNSVG